MGVRSRVGLIEKFSSNNGMFAEPFLNNSLLLNCDGPFLYDFLCQVGLALLLQRGQHDVRSELWLTLLGGE